MGEVVQAVRSATMAAIIAVLCGTIIGGCSEMDELTTTISAPVTPALVPTVIDASKIVVLGDSLSHQSIDQYLAALPGVIVDAIPGRTLVEPMVSDAGIDRIPWLAAAAPRWWVVALGTNDAAYAAHPIDQMAADLATLLSAIGENQCVLWVLPAIGAPAPQTQINGVAGFRELVRSVFNGRPCGALVDWQTVLDNEFGILGDDGIHLTPFGEQRLAEVVREGLLSAGAFSGG